MVWLFGCSWVPPTLHLLVTIFFLAVRSSVIMNLWIKIIREPCNNFLCPAKVSLIFLFYKYFLICARIGRLDCSPELCSLQSNNRNFLFSGHLLDQPNMIFQRAGKEKRKRKHPLSNFRQFHAPNWWSWQKTAVSVSKHSDRQGICIINAAVVNYSWGLMGWFSWKTSY